jgi:molybdate transport system ATP-binding protein
MLLENLRCRSLRIDRWETNPGEIWCLIGGNASGKSLLASVLSGDSTPENGAIEQLPKRVSWASFEVQQSTYEAEIENDDTDYLDRIDHGSTGLQILLQSGADESQARDFASKLRVDYILDRGYKLLSSGEARKLLLLKEILSNPDLLILDEPFEGLDTVSREELTSLCQSLVDEGHDLLFLANRIYDIPLCSTHLGILQRGQLIAAGPKAIIESQPEIRQILTLDAANIPDLPPPPPGNAPVFDTIARMTQCRVQYGDEIQFEDFDWKLNSGAHTIITGPNGAGKSTLLQLLSGDHPQCYSNDLQIFDFQRGSGESIWEIKKHIGIISASLHRDYRAPGNALTTVVSGFYDSIGLYQQATEAQRQLALQWLEVMGLRDQANTYFRQLSWGHQRLVLIARGLIKQPSLLILDEPTQGLDDLNRHLVLAFIEKLAALKRTTLLFVSHRKDENLKLFKNQINFTPSEKEGVHFDVICEKNS